MLYPIELWVHRKSAQEVTSRIWLLQGIIWEAKRAATRLDHRADQNGNDSSPHPLLGRGGEGENRSRPRAAFYSSALDSFARTLKSSSVVVSPFISPPAAICLSKRRMIFPERVLGRASAKRMASGLATGPISLATWLRSSSRMAAFGLTLPLSVTKATSAWPLSSSGRPTTAASATFWLLTSALSTS